MLLRTKMFREFSISAEDDRFGSVADVYFDSAGDWKVRYMAADTRAFLAGGRVLITPELINNLNFAEQSVGVQATKEQIKNSPKPEDHKPVSRSYETKLSDHYNAGSYWMPPAAGAGGAMLPVGGPLVPGQSDMETEPNESTNDNEEYFLQSTEDIKGYSVSAGGKDAGKVTDIVFDTTTWQIRFVEIDTAGLFSKDKTLIPVEQFKEFDSVNEIAEIRSSRSVIEEAPEYDENTALTEEYDTHVTDHYKNHS